MPQRPYVAYSVCYYFVTHAKYGANLSWLNFGDLTELFQSDLIVSQSAFVAAESGEITSQMSGDTNQLKFCKQK